MRTCEGFFFFFSGCTLRAVIRTGEDNLLSRSEFHY